MVRINGLVGNKQIGSRKVGSRKVIKAIALKQGFLNALGSEYDDIKRMLDQMDDTRDEIEKSLD
jgi:hypothetical protein